MTVMPTEVDADRHRTNGANTPEVSTCQNCGQLMPREMRFCRACGCRLGEGIEEYTETVRLPNAPQTARPRPTQTAQAAQSQTSPTDVKDWSAMAHVIGEQARRSATMAATVGLNHWKVARRCRRRVPKWMIWVFLPIIVFSIINGPASFRRRGGNSTAQTSYVGVEFKTADGGVMIQDVTPPGSPADQAGLVGGDLITSLDGKPVTKESDVNNLLAQIPAGKTVDVVYVRDGETRTTKLTTVSDQAINDLREAFDNRPEGQGKLGIDNDAKVVPVPGMNINGVRLGELSPNLPADIAGVRKGDIVIQFGETPIRTDKELINRIHRAVPYSTVNLVVVRDGNRLEIPVKIGKR